MNINYSTGSRTYPITPSRKPGVKAYVRKSRKRISLECMKNASSRQYTIQHFHSLINKELKYLCSDRVNFILQSNSIDSFTWKKLIDELKHYSPTLFGFLHACVKTKASSRQKNSDTVLGICAAILLKHRYFKMSLVQKILSIVLYAGHAGKQVCTY